MKKICTTCHTEKDMAEFRKDRTQKDGYQPRCKLCVRARSAELYSSTYKATVRERDAAIRAANAAKLLEYKQTHPCVCCGESEAVCLDFHHTDPSTKEFGIACGLQRSWAKILKEIKKCVVVCANCHRKVHAELLNL